MKVKIKKQPEYRNQYPIYTEEERENLGLTAGEMFYVGEKLLEKLGIPFDITSAGGSGMFWYTWSYPWVKACGHWPMRDVDRDRVRRLLTAGRDDPSVRPAMEAVSKKYWDNHGGWPGPRPMVVELEDAIGISVADDWRGVLREINPELVGPDDERLDDAISRIRGEVSVAEDDHKNARSDSYHYGSGITMSVARAALAIVEAAKRGRRKFPYPPARGDSPAMDVWASFDDYARELAS